MLSAEFTLIISKKMSMHKLIKAWYCIVNEISISAKTKNCHFCFISSVYIMLLRITEIIFITENLINRF